MTKKNPMVSVIMPVYNSEKFVEEAIGSVLSQTYRNIELVLIDDGSTDNSFEILNRYKSLYPQKISLIRNKRNMGVSATANKGIAAAKGDYISRLDSDDTMSRDRIAKQVAFLQNNPDVVLVGGQVQMMDVTGKPLGMKEFPTDWRKIYETMFVMMPVQQGAMMVNRTKLPEDFVWYKSGSRTAEEVDLFFRLFNYGKFGNVDDTVLNYRQYSTSTSLSDPKKTFYETLKARVVAVREYGYKPTVKSIITNVVQLVIVSILPSFLIYPLFSVLRGISSVSGNVISFAGRVLGNFAVPFRKRKVASWA